MHLCNDSSPWTISPQVDEVIKMSTNVVEVVASIGDGKKVKHEEYVSRKNDRIVTHWFNLYTFDQ